MELKKARFFEAEPGNSVRCTLCPRFCRIAPGSAGYCRVRVNRAGELFAESYGYPVAIQVDPIEKKPLREFRPGSFALSIGTFGCNLGCDFCQNSELSRARYRANEPLRFSAPADLVRLARYYRCESVAFTYNEPTVFFEYAVDTARAVRDAGLAVVLVSNAYINPEPASLLFPMVDAANFDLKSIRRSFYRKHCEGDIDAVKAAIEQFYGMGGYLELTNMVIPGENDSEEDIADLLDYVETHLSRDVPLHFTPFFPRYRLLDVPSTPPETFARIREYAQTRGFRHVYAGR